MNATKFRRIGAIAAAAAFTTTFTISGTTASASTGQRDAAKDRPCFMIRSNWNEAEGPQPRCPKGPRQSDTTSPARTALDARVADFMQ